MSQTYRNLLNDFAHEIGLAADQFLETEEVVIDDLTVSLHFEGDAAIGDVVFFSLLGTPAEARMAEVTRVLLEANHLWVGTGGATLGMSPETGRVMLCGRMPLEALDGKALASLLDAFADTATFWRRYVAGDLSAPSASPETMNFALRG